MRMFNEHGNVDISKDFGNKSLKISQYKFRETNHTFGKCGLIENLVKSDIKNISAEIIVLRRNFVDQCLII